MLSQRISELQIWRIAHFLTIDGRAPGQVEATSELKELLAVFKLDVVSTNGSRYTVTKRIPVSSHKSTGLSSPGYIFREFSVV